MRYKVGMYGGCFEPMHLGHVDCILRAASQCETLYVVLSFSLKEKQIPMRVRYRWLYQVSAHIGNVKLLPLENTAPVKEEYTEEYWQEDAEKVKKMIGQPIDAVFCGNDYGENSFWSQCYPESELVIFPRNGMSSTALREDLYGHWDWLPAPVKPYFVKKVLLFGTESTGKSVLTVSLAQRFSTNYVEETGRMLSEKSGTDELMLPGDYTEILLKHKLNELAAAEHSNKVLFIDTDALITRFFMEFLDDSDPGNVALSEAIDELNHYDLILFTEPDVPFVQDGGRSELIREKRLFFSQRLKKLLTARGRSFECLTGDYLDKYSKAVSLVEKLLRP